MLEHEGGNFRYFHHELILETGWSHEYVDQLDMERVNDWQAFFWARNYLRERRAQRGDTGHGRPTKGGR